MPKLDLEKLKDLQGLMTPYEEPINPEIICNTEQESIDESVVKVIHYLEKMGYIPVSDIPELQLTNV